MASESKNVLIIDDDVKLGQLLNDYLARFAFHVFHAPSPSLGLALLEKVSPDIIILDVMLPEMDGFEVCRQIRKRSQIPIIMLTARGDTTDRIVGLELGADDYLPKPFEPRELVARMQSVLRRSTGTGEGIPQENGILSFGMLKVDLRAHRVWLDENELEFTTMEFSILTLFMKNPGVVFGREQLMEKLRGIEWDVYNRSIDVLMSKLRQKLGDNPKNPRFFKTIWGAGYLFLGDSHEAHSNS